MQFSNSLRLGVRLPAVIAMLLVVAACAKAPMDTQPEPEIASRAAGLDPVLLTHAVNQAKSLRAQGQRVWCVPFARNASGIEIRGNAGTWWNASVGAYDRGHEPSVGAIMAFSATGSLRLGHVAVVSKIISDREVEIDHANWTPNQISLGMRVVDVSDAGDWSSVRVESNPGSLGRVYRLDGFIYPNTTADI